MFVNKCLCHKRISLEVVEGEGTELVVLMVLTVRSDYGHRGVGLFFAENWHTAQCGRDRCPDKRYH